MSKSWLLSKTLWFNAINGLVGFVALLTPDILPFHVTADTWKWQAFILFVGNYALRFMTDKPVTANLPTKNQ